ncbi:MAG: 16S rRNA (adenine(1518)-N(6)/adenine(1519)-N(6))-dimethyltransferase RsmA [Candidatus Micrarchaeota archaeon]
MTLFSELNELMVRYRFKPSPKLSQNFLINEKAISEIVEKAGISKKDTVLEIGGGTGFITAELAKTCQKVICVETDQRLFSLLEERFGDSQNVELIHADFLKALLPQFSKVVSAPPYHISTDLMYRLFELGFEDAYLVMQKEFVERLIAEPGFFDYNALSVITQYYCKTKIVLKVSPSSFFPRPSGESALIHLKFKKRFGSAKNDALFIGFVNQLFRYKNKSIANSLQLAWQFLNPKPKIEMAAAKEKIGRKKIAVEKTYALSAKDFVDLFNELY